MKYLQNLSDETLLQAVEDLDGITVAEDSPLRTIVAQYPGLHNATFLAAVTSVVVPELLREVTRRYRDSLELENKHR